MKSVQTLEPAGSKTVEISRPYLWTTVSASVLILVSSALGLFDGVTYSRYTTDLANQARAQDAADLIGVAVLLVGAYLARRASVRGLQLWAGGLLFLVYAFVIYAFGAPFNDLFLLYVAILGLVAYTFIGGVLRLDFQRVRRAHPSGGRQDLSSGPSFWSSGSRSTLLG